MSDYAEPACPMNDTAKVGDSTGGTWFPHELLDGPREE